MTMADIATRAESLTGACCETDAAIWIALGACPHKETKREGYQDDTGYTCVACGADSWGNRNSFGQKLYDSAPAYTASIDAALTLAPKGSLWSVCDMEDGPYAQVIRPMPCGGYINGLTTGKAVTAALALCGASLRALALTGNPRATSQSETGE